SQLDKAPTVFLQNRIEVLGAILAQARECPALVTPHQAGVADNVCSNDCRQFALLTGHGKSPRSLRGIVGRRTLVGNSGSCISKSAGLTDVREAPRDWRVSGDWRSTDYSVGSW